MEDSLFVTDDGTPFPQANEADETQGSPPKKKQKYMPAEGEECAGDPPAWASTRSELCETMTWFKQYQSGVHTSAEKGCMGLLLDESSGDRSYIDEEIIITRLSGSYKKDKNGDLVLSQNQSILHGYNKAIYQSYQSKSPIGVIIGDRNREIGRPMPHRYNVMDHFIITHIWAEKINGYTGYMMRLQKMVLTRKSWWAAKGSPDPPAVRDFKKRPRSENCLSCMKMSEKIFKDTWTCLHIACPKFWVHYGPENAKLQYDKVFLSHRFSWDKNLVARAPALIPPLPIITLANQEEYRLGYYARHGIVCPLCKRCIPRIFWEGWRCTVEHHARPVPRANETGCSYSLILPDYVAPASEFIALPDSVPQTPPKPRNKAAGKDALLPLGGLESFWNNPRFDEKSLQPKIDRTSLAPYVRLKYDMGVNGTITHLVSNLAINAESSGPDYLFQTFQLLDLGLRRERLGVSQVQGMMTGHLLRNIGLPYKFVVPLQSQSFGDMHSDLFHALGRLVWASHVASAFPKYKHKRLNEMLVLGYVEGMDMGYHDDGDNIGHTVVTISLGASSTMMFRLKSKYYTGLTKDGAGKWKPMDDDPVLPGCNEYELRKTLKQQYDNHEISEQQYRDERSKVLKYIPNPPPVLKMELHHGNILVMSGEGIQKYYEHCVKPNGGLRFAVTARHIDPKSVNPRDVYKGDYMLAPNQVYKGIR